MNLYKYIEKENKIELSKIINTRYLERLIINIFLVKNENNYIYNNFRI